MNSTRRRAALAAVPLLLGACAIDHVSFRPREQATAESPDGLPAAQYRLEHDGATVADVRVWSDGVDRLEDRRVVAHVGLEIENHSDRPLVVDAARALLQAVELAGASGPIERIENPAVFGRVEVDPKGVGRVDLEFPLGEDTRPRDVRAFSASWLIRDPTIDIDYHDVTPFGRLRPRYRTTYGVGVYWFPHHHWGYWGYCW